MPTRTVQLNYISDIHLEWLFDKRGLLQTDVLDAIYRPLFRCNKQPATQHNLLMIAGDLTEARKFHYFVPFLESVIADNGFDRVFYVMGNHEYYGDALHKAVGRIQVALEGSPMLKAHMSILHNQRPLQKSPSPDSRNPNTGFRLFLSPKSLLILPKYPLNPPRIPDNQASGPPFRQQQAHLAC